MLFTHIKKSQPSGQLSQEQLIPAYTTIPMYFALKNILYNLHIADQERMGCYQETILTLQTKKACPTQKRCTSHTRVCNDSMSTSKGIRHEGTPCINIPAMYNHLLSLEMAAIVLTHGHWGNRAYIMHTFSSTYLGLGILYHNTYMPMLKH